MENRKKGNVATRAAKKNKGLFGIAARGLGSRKSRIDSIVDRASSGKKPKKK